GLGALISPLVATHFAKNPEHWSFHFIISAGLYVTNDAFLWAAFRTRQEGQLLTFVRSDYRERERVSRSNKFKQIMRIKSVHALSFFALVNVDIEVTLGVGWSVTYILEKRGGSFNFGYISSRFFGVSIMLGRFLLLWLNRKLGKHRALFIYAFMTNGRCTRPEARRPSPIENALAVSFVGLLLGPMFHILMNHSTINPPAPLAPACSGYIAGAGQAGSAVLPFITGLLAQKFGIASLQPFVVSMMSTLIVLWAVIPRARYVPT
ncbi:MFS general substrate transporter, partial [Lentinus brumalis]